MTNPQTRVGIITWDHREHPDPDRLTLILSDLTEGLIHVRTPDTGSDQYALLISTRPLDQTQADDVFDRWWRDDEASDVLNIDTTKDPR